MFHIFDVLTNAQVVVFLVLLQKSQRSLQQTRSACDEDMLRMIDIEGINRGKMLLNIIY